MLSHPVEVNRLRVSHEINSCREYRVDAVDGPCKDFVECSSAGAAAAAGKGDPSRECRVLLVADIGIEGDSYGTINGCRRQKRSRGYWVEPSAFPV